MIDRKQESNLEKEIDEGFDSLVKDSNKLEKEWKKTFNLIYIGVGAVFLGLVSKNYYLAFTGLGTQVAGGIVGQYYSHKLKKILKKMDNYVHRNKKELK